MEKRQHLDVLAEIKMSLDIELEYLVENNDQRGYNSCEQKESAAFALVRRYLGRRPSGTTPGVPVSPLLLAFLWPGASPR